VVNAFLLREASLSKIIAEKRKNSISLDEEKSIIFAAYCSLPRSSSSSENDHFHRWWCARGTWETPP
jgi:hypothetical protein